jgi:hypothetical protein
MAWGDRLAGWQKAEVEEKRQGGMFVLWIFWTLAICAWFFTRPKLVPKRLTAEEVVAIDAAEEAAQAAAKGKKKKKRADGAQKARAAREAAEAARRAKEAAADEAAAAAPLRRELTEAAVEALLPSDDEDDDGGARREMRFPTTNKGMKKALAINKEKLAKQGYTGPVRLGARRQQQQAGDADFWDMGEEGENSGEDSDAGWVGVRAPAPAPAAASAAATAGFTGALRLAAAAPNTEAGHATAALARSTHRGNAPAPEAQGAPALTKKQRESKRKKERAKFIKERLREQAQTESTGHAERTILSLQKRGALG